MDNTYGATLYRRRALLAGLIALAAWRGACAAPSGSEGLFLGDIPAVLTATRLAQRPQDAPAAVFVIDREMIEASGAREVVDLVRLAPGFIVASQNGHTRIVGYHGFIDEYGRRMQVLVDGRSVYDPFFGGLRWAELPVAIDDIQRIEVIRGANGASHGANAFLGVINIITHQPAATQGVLLRAAGGDPDYSQAVLRHGFTLGQAEIRYTLGYEEDSGFRQRDGREAADGKQLTLATFDLATMPHAAGQLRLTGGFKEGDAGFGDADDALDPAREMAVRSSFLQLRWEHDINPDHRVALQGYVNRTRIEDRYQVAEPPLFATVDNSRESTRYALEMTHNVQLGDGRRLAWGGELRRDEVDSSTIFRGDGTADNAMARLFANVEWRLDDATLVNAGAMIEHHALTGTDLSPRLSLHRQLAPGHALRVTLSRSTRVPSLFEAGADFYHEVDVAFGTPDGVTDAIWQEFLDRDRQRPETVDSLELGWLFDLSATHGLRGDVKLFHERYRKLIGEYRYPLTLRDDLALCDPALNPVVGVGTGVPLGVPEIAAFLESERWLDRLGVPAPWVLEPSCNLHTGFDDQVGLEGPEAGSYANMFGFDLSGFELSLDWRPRPAFRAVLAYHYARLSNLDVTRPELLDNPFYPIPPDDIYPGWLQQVSGELERSVPRHNLSLMLILRPGHDITLSATLQYLSAMQYLESGDPAKGHARVDLRAAKGFRMGGGWGGEVYFVVQNLGTDYTDFERSHPFPTRIFAGVKLAR